MLSDSLANAYSAAQGTVEVTTLHIFGAIEAQLLADTGRNFINPLMSVAIIAQGGAVLGYLLRHRKNVKTKELCIPSFISVLFGITEPALFGINIRYKFPIIGGCIGGALGGIVVYLTDLAAVGFGTTVLPGIALADPAGNGYANYVIAHAVAITGGFAMTLVLGKFMDKTPEEAPASGGRNRVVSEGTAQGTPVSASGNGNTLKASGQEGSQAPAEEIFWGYADGQQIAMEDVPDETFANKVLGDGVAVLPEAGKVYAPADGTIISVFDTKHAVCFASKYGTEILIHIGIDTVNLQGNYFTAHVKDGDAVKQGQLLIEFDKEQIEKAGYATAIPMIFTDLPEEKKLVPSAPGTMAKDTKAAIIRKG